MTAAALPLGPRGQAGMATSSMTASRRRTCAVRLIDRRTGEAHRINGSPFVLFTKTPEAAAAELLAKRDAAVWEARIEPISSETQRFGGCH
ncbi:MAG TPA: hypothetical protein PLI43_05690 [Albidovulum sp.]|uniref:hypothetical protein n=1 Tax=Albidovulum sp. TaxID=1872424 RepID=UPI002CB62DB9|nr:hypothetical protein [Albidovulum sp.]